MEYKVGEPVITDFVFRAASDGSSIFEGYAAIFNHPSRPITDQYGVGYVETIAPGTFKRSINSGRRQTFVVDHNDRLHIASTAGRLRLGEDSKGLAVESPWPNTDYANNVRALYDAGETLGMSIRFGPTKQGHTWDAMRTRHHVTDAALAHVSVLASMEPAFDGTSAAFRALAEQTESDVEDLDALFEAVRSGTPLTDEQKNLLTRLVPAVVPEAGEATAERSQEPVDPKQTLAYWQGKFPALDTSA
jgi:HK97 family phage prohead protease